MRFDASILQSNRNVREPIITILEAALDAVDPYRATTVALELVGHTLSVAGHDYNLATFRRIVVVGAGRKAGAPMTQAVEDILGNRIDAGLVVVKYGHSAPTRLVEIVEASHPRPDEAGVAAGEKILTLAQAAQENDLVIALLSGGGSALLVAPAPGITLADMQTMTDALLASGATIHEMNCLRKHCETLKGGQLARAVAPATLITLALSDVVGSPLDVIASGPTVPDETTWQDAWAIVRRYELESSLPDSIIARLEAGLQGEITDTPKAGDSAFAATTTLIVGDNRVAAEAAQKCSQELGYHALLLTTYLEGEAAQVAKVAVALGREIAESSTPLAPPACLILGGETTVALGKHTGKGGRNQELALSAAIALAGAPEITARAITIVSLATDGSDGPTDSAGGIVDGSSRERGRTLGLDADEYLRSHNAYPYLQATGDLLLTGPTQTNVNDLVFVFVGTPTQ